VARHGVHHVDRRSDGHGHRDPGRAPGTARRRQLGRRGGLVVALHAHLRDRSGRLRRRRSEQPDRLLDVNGGGTPAAGAGIIIYTCKSPQTALGNQSFRFAQDANGAYRVDPGSGSPANTLVWAQTGAGTAVRLAAVSTADAQQWTVVAFGATGEYRVMSRTGSLCLTQSSNAEAGAVTAAACAANSTATNAAYLAQRFTFTEIAS
jgi:hypothetical protein